MRENLMVDLITWLTKEKFSGSQAFPGSLKLCIKATNLKLIKKLSVT